jgi:hypothetical protein
MGRKKKRLLLAKILGRTQVPVSVNDQITDSVTVAAQVVKEEPEPVVAEVVAEEEVEVPSVITEALEAVKPPERLVKLAKKK